NKDSTGRGNAIGDRVQNGIGFSDSTGLNPLQFRDIGFYLNGTIGQVMAARTIATTIGSTSANTSTSATAAAGATGPGVAGAGATGAGRGLRRPPDSTIKYEGPTSPWGARRPRRAASTRQGNGGDNNFGATIRTIEINGRPFQLRGGTGNGNTTTRP